MAETTSKPAVAIRDLQTLDELERVEEVEREVWGLLELDVIPLTLAIASGEAGGIWIGAFDGAKLVGFPFTFWARSAAGSRTGTCSRW